MTRIELADDELRIVQSALRSYLSDFGHDEAAELQAIKRVMAKIAASPRSEDT
jgi:hypothetical protein